jgi:hypothetical protein
LRSYWKVGISPASGTYAYSDDISEASQIPPIPSARAASISA